MQIDNTREGGAERSNLNSFAVVDGGAIAIALLVVVPVRIAFLILAYTPILLDVV